MILGLDIDNTVIDYSPAVQALAPRFGIQGAQTHPDAKNMLAAVDASDLAWQAFQAALYTEGLQYATPAPGLFAFLEVVAAHCGTVFLASHKTATTQSRFGSQDLRTRTLDWLSCHKITDLISHPAGVQFFGREADKIEHIRHLKPSIFVDDHPRVIGGLIGICSGALVHFDAKRDHMTFHGNHFSGNFLGLKTWFA